jgi:hypothetical protein
MMGNRSGPPLNKGGHATFDWGIDGIVEASSLSRKNQVMPTKTKVVGWVSKA